MDVYLPSKILMIGSNALVVLFLYWKSFQHTLTNIQMDKNMYVFVFGNVVIQNCLSGIVIFGGLVSVVTAG